MVLAGTIIFALAMMGLILLWVGNSIDREQLTCVQTKDGEIVCGEIVAD